MSQSNLSYKCRSKCMLSNVHNMDLNCKSLIKL